MLNQPLYPIGIISELLNVHPETVRSWEKYDVVQPQRRSGKRFYSDSDLKRMRFIQRLTEEGLNLPAIRHYLQLYPCWRMDDCPGCMHRSQDATCAKPCWKEEGTYCQVYGDQDMCLNCEFRKQHEQQKAVTIDQTT